MPSLRFAGVALAFAMAIPAVPAGEPAAVPVRAMVTDKAGRFVDGLTAADFAVTYNGKKLAVLSVRTDTRPLSLVLALDRSGSFVSIADRVDAVAQHVVTQLVGSDRVRVLQFTSQILMTPEDFTNDRARLMMAIPVPSSLRGPTSFWDAVIQGAIALGTAPGQRALLVVSDGQDSSSTAKVDQAIQACQDRGVSVHAIATWSEPPNVAAAMRGNLITEPHRDLKKLTLETGGGYVPLKLKDDPVASATVALNGLRNGYLLEFVPTISDGKRHEVEVRVTRPGVTVVTARTYAAGQ